jgi:hypothetical protein
MVGLPLPSHAAVAISNAIEHRFGAKTDMQSHAASFGFTDESAALNAAVGSSPSDVVRHEGAAHQRLEAR